MTEIQNLSALCRCCHADGAFKSLQAPHVHDGAIEIYAVLLRDTFGINIINPPMVEASYTICESCINQLWLAHRFKKQVLQCERKLEEYCKSDQTIVTTDGEFDLDNHVIIISYDDDGEENEFEAKVEDETANEVDIKSKTEPQVRVGEDHAGVNSDDAETKEFVKDEADAGGIVTKNREIKCGHASNASNLKRVGPSIQNISILYKCEFCVKTFPVKRQLDEHQQRLHNGDRPFLCDTCSKGFPDKPSLKEHTILEHNQTKEEMYVCDFCKKIFTRRTYLAQHIKSHTGISQVFVCETCGREFHCLRTLKRHVDVVHEKLRPYKCDLCNKNFTAKRSLDLHHNSFHSDEGRYQCDLCGTGFPRKDRLREHLIEEHDKTGHVCEICNKVYKTHKYLKQHIKLHTDHTKPFMCEACGRRFKRPIQLRRHVSSVHEKLKPFKCESCGRTFSLRNALIFHTKTFHTGDRPFQCEICSLGFATEERFKEHCKRQHSKAKRVYDCSYCKKRFKAGNTLRRHVSAVHYKLKPHKCDLCDKAFTERQNLNTHKMRCRAGDKYLLVNISTDSTSIKEES